MNIVTTRHRCFERKSYNLIGSDEQKNAGIFAVFSIPNDAMVILNSINGDKDVLGCWTIL
jgi:hypothetical protein